MSDPAAEQQQRIDRGEQKCECPDVASEPRYHGGQSDQCPRDAADHSPVVASPALCLPCLHGCELS